MVKELTSSTVPDEIDARDWALVDLQFLANGDFGPAQAFLVETVLRDGSPVGFSRGYGLYMIERAKFNGEAIENEAAVRARVIVGLSPEEVREIEALTRRPRASFDDWPGSRHSRADQRAR